MRGSAAAVMLTRQEGGGKSPAHRHVFCAYTPPSFDPSPRTRTSCQEEGRRERERGYNTLTQGVAPLSVRRTRESGARLEHRFETLLGREETRNFGSL